jgi:hypothetical protein
MIYLFLHVNACPLLMELPNKNGRMGQIYLIHILLYPYI